MDVLLALFAFGISVSCWVRLRSLEAKIRAQQRLLQTLQRLEKEDSKTVSTQPSKAESFAKPDIDSEPVRKQKISQTLAFGSFQTWLGQNLLVSVGAFFVLIGAGWLLTYLYQSEILTLEWILGGLFILGVGVAGFGDFEVNSRRVVGQVLLLLGIAISVAVTVAATVGFEYLPVTLGFGVVFGLSLFLFWRALVHRARGLNLFALVTLFFIPALFDTGTPDWFFLAQYGLGVSVLGVVLAFWQKRAEPALLALLGLGGYASAALWALGEWQTEFALVYLALVTATLTGLCRVKPTRSTITILSAAFGFLLSLGLTFGAVAEVWQEATLLILVLISLGVSFGYQQGGREFGRVAQLSLSLGYLTVYLLTRFGETDFAPVILASAALLALVLNAFNRPNRYLEAVLCAGELVLLLIVFGLFEDAGYLPNLAGLTTVLALSGVLLYRRSRPKTDFEKITARAVVFGAVVAGHALVWESLRQVIADNSVAAGLSLLLYAITPLLLLYRYRLRDLFWRGTVWLILGFVVLRLLLVEIWIMALPVRILTFVAVGIVFIFSAYLHRKQN